MTPNHDQARSTAYSEAQASEYDTLRFTAPSGRLIHQRELDLVKAACPSDGIVIEVGCGTGRLMRDLAPRTALTAGVDLSHPMLKRLRDAPALEDTPVVVAEAASLPFREGCADHLYSVRLLNQTGSPTYALDVARECARLLSPGASIQIEFQNARRLRPLGTKTARRTVRLRPGRVVRELEGSGLVIGAVRGAFFFGMTGYLRCPARVLKAWDRVDRALSRLAPRACSRVYVHATRPEIR
jgi:ubiquinone/menaquinone biosynthesis C-methylase UbiE